MLGSFRFSSSNQVIATLLSVEYSIKYTLQEELKILFVHNSLLSSEYASKRNNDNKSTAHDI